MTNTRQEVVNTFDKGLIMDLNPMNTPSNVLTDCLNGTFITYDGNEFHLQNDKGNISLKSSKLRKGYLPVGTASYGDILYIVSYNPLENRTQIGTFPSPKLLSNYDHDCDLENPSIMTQEGDDVIKYTEAIDRHQQLVVYFGDKDELIINPGDQYNIEPPGEYVEDFEKLEYFIFTENKELINITDLVIPDAQYHYVKWKVPGYLATRWRLPQINENGFSIRTKSITLKEPATATINCQIASDDELIDNLYKKSYLKAAEVSDKDGSSVLKDITMKDRIVYDSVNYYNTDIECPVNVSEETYQTFLAPYADDGTRKLLFDQFVQASELIDLANTFNPNNTHIADEYYNYTVNDNKATINFNIDCSVVSEGEVGLYIDYVPLYEYINNGYSVEGLFSDSDDRDNVFDGVGQNIVEITFDKPEQVYLLRIEMSDGIAGPVYCYKILICSEFMNNFSSEEYPNFEDITMDKWLNYLGEIEVISSADPTFGEPFRTGHFSENVVIDDCFWHASRNIMNCFVLPESDEKERIDIYRRGYTYTIPNVNIPYKHRQKYLYNFCKANYNNGELKFPKAPFANKTISNGNETNASINGNISDNFYVEHQYKDQNEETTQGAVFNFKPASEGRNFLVVELARSNPNNEGYLVMGTQKTAIIYENPSGDATVLRTMVWGLTIPDNVSGENYVFKHSEYSTNLLADALILKNVKQSGIVDSVRKKINSVVNNFLETKNIACCPGVITMYQPTTAKAVGFSTNHFTTYAFVPGVNTGGDDRRCSVFGVFFRATDDRILFVPYRQMSDYAMYMRSYDGGTDEEKRDRDDCGWDAGLTVPIVSKNISEDGRTGPGIVKNVFDINGNWQVSKSVYDKLLSFVNKLQVNINYAEFTNGFFLNRTLLKEIQKTKLSIDYNANVIIDSIQIKETAVVLLSGQSLPNTNEISNLKEMFSANWSNGREVSSTGTLISNKEICSFENKKEWPYVGNDSLEYVASKYDIQNDIIATQYENWLISVEYQNVNSGMSIGFYSELETPSDLFDKFTSLIRSTYNSDSQIYRNKGVNRLSNILADVSNDAVDIYWAFTVADSDQYRPDFDFEDFTENQGRPRYKFFISKDMPYMSIRNLLNEEENEING